MYRSRQFSGTSGLSALDVIAILATIVVVVAMIVPKIENYRDKQARLNVYQAIRDGDMRILERALQPKAVGETPIDPHGTYSEEWTGPDGTVSTMRYGLLSYAVKWNHAEVVKACIEYGSNVDGKTWANDRQPIFWAAYNENQEIFDMLIAAGADINAIVAKKTALGHAEGAHENAAAFLRANGAESQPEDEEA